jgi:hypothetical protein
VDRFALYRQVGVRAIEGRLKTAQVHPVDTMRRSAAYNVGMHDLAGEYGLDPNDAMVMQRALAQNEDYYNRVRTLHDQYMGQPATLSEAVAEGSGPKIQADNVPKVVSSPK